MESLTHHSAPPTQSFVLANTPEESSFDFWGVLGRRKWLVFLGLVTGLALGGLYHAQCEVLYESKASVKIEPKNPTIFHLTPTEVIGPKSADFVSRHDRFIGGYNIVNKCLIDNDLMDLPSFNDLTEREVVEYVMENLDCAPDKEEPVLYELKFYCKNQDDVSMILNHLILTYKSELDETYKVEADKYKELLDNVKNSFDGRWMELQAELKEAQKNYNVPMVSAGVNLHQQAIYDLGRAMQVSRNLIGTWAATRLRVLEALEQGPEAIKATYYNLVQQDQIKDFSLAMRAEKGGSAIDLQISQMETELEEKLLLLGAGHIDIRSLKAAIEKKIAYRDANQSESALMNDDPLLALNRFLASLEQRIADEQVVLNRDVSEYIKHEAEAARLAAVQRQIEVIEREIHDVGELKLLADMKKTEVDPSMELNNRARNEGYIFDVIMNATKGKQVWPILPAILGIGGLLGLLGGFALGCLVEFADKTFHNPDEIMKQLQIPLIGHIPVIGQSKRYVVENSLIDPIVCTYHRPKSQVSESFRAVRTSLYFNTQGKQQSVVQITSPTPGDGKSTLASNLAVSIAQSGKRVLLVDGDMRRPRQAATFGITSKTGFATVLSGESQWRDVVYECEEIEGLMVMPCGAKPNNPAELSSSPQVKELIEEMRQEFDFVIIDTPPLLAVTDACPIAARVDGVILCIRIKKNVRVSAERATEMLTNLGANCLGLVVNGVGAQSGYGSQYTYGAYRAGYSYNGYGYGYGYGYGAGGKYYEDDRTAANTANGPKHIEAQRTEQPPVV